MWGDYGYIEDGYKKGYDLKIIRRFLGYAKPYWLVLVISSILILAATAADLVLPYLTKTAIDRHIVVSYQEVHSKGQNTNDVLENLKDSLFYSGKPGLYFLRGDKARQLDPALIKESRQAGILKNDQYYLVEEPNGQALEVINSRPELFRIFPYAAVISFADLDKLTTGELKKLRGNDLAGLAHLAVFGVVVLILGYIFNFAQVILLEYAGQKLTHDIRQELVAHVLKQSVSFHDHTPTGRLVARLTNDIQNLGEMIRNVAVTFFKDAFILVGIIVILVYLNLKLALITFSLLPLIIVTTMLFRSRARDVFRALRAKVAEINSVFGETISGIQIIQAFRREKRNLEDFEKLNHDNYLAGMKQIRVFAVFMPLIDVFAAVALGLIVWYGGWSVLDETVTLGVVVAFIGYVRKFFQPIRDLVEKFNILQSAMASLERIFLLLDAHEEMPSPQDPEAIPEGGHGVINFDDVGFSYSEGEEVLCDLSFEVEQGKTLAIVGATGAGKTSIINLLLRFYDIKSGLITVDGQDIRNLPLAEHRSRIGLVMQDVFIFAGTIRENIALARNDISEETIMRAVKAVGADKFIEALPGGYDHMLGEGGKSLSVGQRQLLAFARVLAQNPQILVLDEATAFIDSESEKLIEAALGPLTEGRTSIVIAHRLSTIRRADRILVLHRGCGYETGTHDELLEQKGLYYQLHRLQLSRSGWDEPFKDN